MPTPSIHTERLTLSPLTRADVPALFAYRALDDVARYQHWQPRDIDDARRFVDELAAVEFDVPGTWCQFGIRLRESGALVGDLGVHFFEDGRQAEIGFTLAPSSQRRGYGTEAVTAVIAYLFGRLNKHRVIASVDPRNEPSVRLLARVGMRREAHHRQSLWFKGEWADDLVFAILASEWQTVRSPDSSEGTEPRREDTT
jgi:RimJ/RimL family protein N-acetyltransferase